MEEKFESQINFLFLANIVVSVSYSKALVLLGLLISFGYYVCGQDCKKCRGASNPCLDLVSKNREETILHFVGPRNGP